MTITTEEVTALLTEHLISVIKSDYTALVDLDNKLKSAGELTPEQAQLIDMVDFKGMSTMSKSKAIDLLAKISGLNSSTTKLTGTDGPLELKFSINYVDPD